jgi:hypothetical protein
VPADLIFDLRQCDPTAHKFLDRGTISDRRTCTVADGDWKLQNYEAFDAVTGVIGTSTENPRRPVSIHFV